MQSYRTVVHLYLGYSHPKKAFCLSSHVNVSNFSINVNYISGNGVLDRWASRGCSNSLFYFLPHCVSIWENPLYVFICLKKGTKIFFFFFFRVLNVKKVLYFFKTQKHNLPKTEDLKECTTFQPFQTVLSQCFKYPFELCYFLGLMGQNFGCF